MSQNFKAIPQLTLNKIIDIKQPAYDTHAQVDLDSPAIEVMTDLSIVTPATTHSHTLLKQANQQMITRAVRMLFVVDQNQQLEGIITSNDILGEKPLQFAQRVGCSTSEILVADIMTPLGQIQILDFDDIERARVGNIIETLKRSGRHHALAAEKLENGQQQVCGIFSLSHISRLMNSQVEVVEIASTFAEVELALHH